MSKRAADHNGKASASLKAVNSFKRFSREPVIIKLSPEDSKAFVEAMGNPVDLNKVFAKTIELYDGRVSTE